jgi:uncharacterized membrane protein YhhN
MKQTTFTLYFFTIGIIFIILEQFDSFFPALVVKALIIPALMLYYHSRIRKSYSGFHLLIMIGLFFSWLGDILLQFSNQGVEFYYSAETYFLFGLAAFFLTQVFYSLAFLKPKGRNTLFNKRIYQLILVLGYGGLLMWFLYNKIEAEYKLPVILYAIVIHTMLITALNRYGKVNGVSYMLVVFGAMFFVLSDSMIAVNRFVLSDSMIIDNGLQTNLKFARIFIMVTYVVAQYLIVIGCLRQNISEEKVA